MFQNVTQIVKNSFNDSKCRKVALSCNIKNISIIKRSNF